MVVKNLDKGVVQRLEEQAAAAGVPLQWYVQNELTRIASRLSPAELVSGRQPMNRSELEAIRQRLRSQD